MTAAPEQLRALVAYLRDMGVYDFYHRDDPQTILPESLRDALLAARPSPLATPNRPLPEAGARVQVPARPTPSSPLVPQQRPAAVAPPPPSYFSTESREPPELTPDERFPPLPPELAAPMPKPVSFDALAPLPVQMIEPAQKAAALEAVRADIGDCTRCPLAYAGRRHIVFADGDPNARLMFVGEGPGADEDATGLPFVGKAGQLLNNMIVAMGLRREDVYIANIVKCRPPGNRTPEFVEASTCSQFLVRQIDIVRPQVIVALGSTAATYLLGVRQSLSSLRGRWHSTRGAKLAVTYHPAFLLRDPRQKAEAWKDLQMVMKYLGLKPPEKK
jgi:uracil-DNA glycosylase